MTRSATGTAKIAMVGAGQVDVTLACMIRDTGQTHRPVRPQRGERPGRGLDLQHGLQFMPTGTVTGS